MAGIDRMKILTEGRAEILVHRSGMQQRIIFTVKRIDTPAGPYPVLYTDRLLDFKELARVAQEYDLPVQAPNGTAFPKGKGPNDYRGLI
ncbi:MAG: hypothetical protein QW112_01690 [Candidatus Micrarchaeia archaeon]